MAIDVRFRRFSSILAKHGPAASTSSLHVYYLYDMQDLNT